MEDRDPQAVAPNVKIEETEKEVHITITDLQLHASEPRKPHGFARGIKKAIETGKPGRAYAKNAAKAVDRNKGTFEIAIPSEGLAEVIEQAKAKGKIVRFFIPRAGIPIFLGKDAIEKMESLKRKGLL